MRLNISNDPEVAFAQLRRYDFLTPDDLSDVWSTYAPTFTGFATAPKNNLYRYKILGNKLTLCVRIGNFGTSNGVTFLMTAPMYSANIPNMYWGTTAWQAYDNGALLAAPAQIYLPANSNVIQLFTNTAGAAWTNVNGKGASFTLEYEI